MLRYADFEGRIARGCLFELFRLAWAAVSLFDYDGDQRVRILSAGHCAIRLIMQVNNAILLPVCCVDDFMWPITKDTVVIRIGIRFFAFALPGLLFGLELSDLCHGGNIDALANVFRKYGTYHDIRRGRGYPVRDDDPRLLEKMRPTFEPMAHETLAQLGHVPGRSRFILENHNSSFKRACLMSAATKLIFQGMSTKTLNKMLVKITGTHSNSREPHPSRAYPTMSIFLSLVDTAEYSTFLFCDCLHGDTFMEDLQPPPRDGQRGYEIGHRVWNLNGEGRKIFMSRLIPYAKAEEEALINANTECPMFIINPRRYSAKDEEVGETSTPPTP